MKIDKYVRKCDSIEHVRSTPSVLLKLVEEVGELSTEVNVKYFKLYKEAGSDGIVGECADIMICLFDILYQEDVNIDDFEEIVKAKMKKWKNAGGNKND